MLYNINREFWRLWIIVLGIRWALEFVNMFCRKSSLNCIWKSRSELGVEIYALEVRTFSWSRKVDLWYTKFNADILWWEFRCKAILHRTFVGKMSTHTHAGHKSLKIALRPEDDTISRWCCNQWREICNMVSCEGTNWHHWLTSFRYSKVYDLSVRDWTRSPTRCCWKRSWFRLP